jgi:hypothetical protein
MLVYKLSTPTVSAAKDDDGPYDDSPGNKARPGVTAGIALGTIFGFGLLLFLIFYGVRIHRRRKQRQAGGSDENRSSMRRAGDVSDIPFTSSITTEYASLNPERRTSSSTRPKEMTAASTGAEWNSPSTPRAAGDAAPKLTMNHGARNAAWDDIPNTPTLFVQHPESVVQNPGLGDRAWHRRRLSAPFPPPGSQKSDGSVVFGSGRSRAAEEASTSHGADGGTGTPWEDAWGALMPSPLALPPFGNTRTTSVSAGEDGRPSTGKTMWTVHPSDSSLCGSSVDSVDSGGRAGSKTSKTE